MNKVDTFKPTVAQSAQISSAIELDGAMLLRVALPTMTSTSMGVQTSHDGVTYQALYKDGSDVAIVIASSKNVDVSDYKIVANYVKLTFGSQEAAARALTATALRMD